jgi:glycosyltransferase involved in cell wall biosynthesis
MKILFLNSDAELYGNGADKILLLTINALASHHDIDVVLPYHGPLVDAIKQSNINCQVIPYAVLRRNSASPLRLIKFSTELILTSYTLYRYIKKHNIDIIYANTSSILQGLVLRATGLTRQIWHIHEIIDEPWYARIIFSKLITKGSDLSLCVSNAVKSHIQENSNNLVVVWNGIPPVSQDHVTFKRVGIPNVLVLGRFNRMKGQQHLVRSIKLLKDGPLNNTKFLVRLVGGVYDDDETFLNSTRNLIRILQLEDTVSIEGCIKDISRICSSATVLVIPSERPDPFPTVALEAMSIGTPVMGYWQGGLPEMLNYDDQCLAQFKNHFDLAYKLLPFIINEEFRIRKAQKQNKRYQEHFTYSHYETRLRSAINSLSSTSITAHH